MATPRREDPRDIDAIHDLRAVLPTRRRAQLLFETLSARSARTAVLSSANRGSDLRLFRRDPAHPETVVPWYWLRFSVWSPSAAGEAGAPASPVPRGRGPGRLEIRSDTSRLEFLYDDAGAIHETSRGGPNGLWLELAHAVREAEGNAFEALIDAVANTTTEHAGPNRLLAPRPCPHSIEHAFGIALGAVREACFERELAPEALWIAADGFAGSIVVAHSEREVALALCREAIAREKPRPKPPQPSPMPMPEELAALGMEGELYHVQGPVHDDASVPPGVDNTPILLTPLEALPQRPSPLATWERLLDAHGKVSIVAARRDRRGTLIASPRALARLVPSQVDAALAAADRRELVSGHFAIHPPWPASLPPLRSQIWVYAVEHARSGIAVARIRSASRTPAFRYSKITPESLGEGILRQEWVR